MTKDNIKVYVRVRPPPGEGWAYKPQIITDLEANKDFYFERVFPPLSTNPSVYNVIGKPMVQAILDGYNGTIFAYGQTGSGKTHSLLGEDGNEGIIPLLFRELFARIEAESKSNPSKIYLMRMSYVEIYNEDVFDLLISPKDPFLFRSFHSLSIEKLYDKNSKIKLHIRQHPKDETFYVQNLKEEFVSSIEEVKKVIAKGNKNRQIGVSNLNEHSSRSHAVIRLVLESGVKADPTSTLPPTEQQINGKVVLSELNMIDLAGSEILSYKFSELQRLEARHINVSLTQLKTVVTALYQGESFIPYRNSSLTKILKKSLGGNSKTSILCTISPAPSQHKMSRNTLLFGQMAKTIQNEAYINEFFDDDARLVLKQYKKQVEDACADRDRIQKEMNEMQSQYTNELENVNQYVAELSQRIEEMNDKHAEELKAKTKEIDNLLSKFEAQRTADLEQERQRLAQVIEDHKAELERINREREVEQKRLQTDHKAELARLEEERKKERTQMEKEMQAREEKLLARLKEKMNHLLQEKDEEHKRELEDLQKQKELESTKLQSDFEARLKALEHKQDIDSKERERELQVDFENRLKALEESLIKEKLDALKDQDEKLLRVIDENEERLRREKEEALQAQKQSLMAFLEEKLEALRREKDAELQAERDKFRDLFGSQAYEVRVQRQTDIKEHYEDEYLAQMIDQYEKEIFRLKQECARIGERADKQVAENLELHRQLQEYRGQTNLTLQKYEKELLERGRPSVPATPTSISI